MIQIYSKFYTIVYKKKECMRTFVDYSTSAYLLLNQRKYVLIMYKIFQFNDLLAMKEHTNL